MLQVSLISCHAKATQFSGKTDSLLNVYDGSKYLHAPEQIMFVFKPQITQICHSKLVLRLNILKQKRHIVFCIFFFFFLLPFHTQNPLLLLQLITSDLRPVLIKPITRIWFESWEVQKILVPTCRSFYSVKWLLFCFESVRL